MCDPIDPPHDYTEQDLRDAEELWNAEPTHESTYAAYRKRCTLYGWRPIDFDTWCLWPVPK